MEARECLEKLFLHFNLNQIKNMYYFKVKEYETKETFKQFQSQFLELNKKYFFKKSLQSYFEEVLKA